MAEIDYERAKAQIKPLLQDRRLVKEEIMEILHCDERTARKIVRKIAEDEPVPSLSSRRGYYIADPQKDAAAIRKAIAENEHRAAEILKRNIPLKRSIGEL